MSYKINRFTGEFDRIISDLDQVQIGNANTYDKWVAPYTLQRWVNGVLVQEWIAAPTTPAAGSYMGFGAFTYS